MVTNTDLEWSQEYHAQNTDWSRLNLEHVRTHAELQMAFMKAEADYAYRMTQVAELQQQISQSIDKQMMLRSAFQRYARMLNDSEKQIKDARRFIRKLDRMIYRANMLYLGESLDRGSVSKAWTGFRWLFKELEGEKTAAAFIRVAEADLRVGNFFCPKEPQRKMDGHQNLSTIFQLAMHCRGSWRHQRPAFVPVVGSSFMTKLMVIFELIDNQFGEQAELLRMELKERIARNQELSQKHFADVSTLF